jgi:hypothetical protein
VVVEDHRGRDRGQQPAHLGVAPGLGVEPGVLLEVGRLGARRLAEVPPGRQPGAGRRGDLVGVDLVAQHHQRVGPLVLRDGGDLPGVAVQRVRRDALAHVHGRGRGVAAGAEGDGERALAADRADPARREGGVRLRPHAVAVEVHLVRGRAARLEVLHEDQGVVVSLHAEGARPAAEHRDLTGAVGLHPDGRRHRVDVA